ncbi:TPA: discoidin domain-containing protein, partial [Streptococcus suis]
MNRQDKNYQKLYQYSIRKRNWGVGSVVVGIFLAGMLQAPTVLANSGATASEPIIENQADSGGGTAGSSEVAQPAETTPVAQPAAETLAPVGDTTTRSAENNTSEGATGQADNHASNGECPVEEQELRDTVRVVVPLDPSYANASSFNPNDNGSREAIHAVDSNETTYWTSHPDQTNTAENPQWLEVRLIDTARVDKVMYTPRQGNGEVVGNIIKGKILYSENGTEWFETTPTGVTNFPGTSTLGSVNRDEKSFTLNSGGIIKMINIEPVNAKYFRLVGLTTRHWDTSKVNTVLTAADFVPIGTKEESRLDKVAIDPQLTHATSEESNDDGPKPVSNAIDGDEGTFWESEDSNNNNSPESRQQLTIGLTEPALINVFEYKPRGSSARSVGNIKQGYLEYKLGPNDQWQRVTLTGGLKTATGEFILDINSGYRKYIHFEPVYAQYLRLTATQTYHWSTTNPDKSNTVVAAAEVGVHAYKVVEKSETVSQPIVETIIEREDIPRDTPDRVESPGRAESVTTVSKHLTRNGEALCEELDLPGLQTVVTRVEGEPKVIIRGIGEPQSETPGGETTPGETTPGETTPGETTPGETTPGETTPGETTPGETTP